MYRTRGYPIDLELVRTLRAQAGPRRTLFKLRGRILALRLP